MERIGSRNRILSGLAIAGLGSSALLLSGCVSQDVRVGFRADCPPDTVANIVEANKSEALLNCSVGDGTFMMPSSVDVVDPSEDVPTVLLHSEGFLFPATEPEVSSVHADFERGVTVLKFTYASGVKDWSNPSNN